MANARTWPKRNECLQDPIYYRLKARVVWAQCKTVQCESSSSLEVAVVFMNLTPGTCMLQVDVAVCGSPCYAN